MEKKVTISVAIATFNEEANLGRCLESVSNWVDEIVIVDGGSTDKTLEIAQQYHAKIIRTTNPPIFHVNKQKALDACRGDWILQLDADEIVSPELSNEILEVIHMSKEELLHRIIDSGKEKLFERHKRLIEERDGTIGGKSQETVAFFVPRRNYFLGKPLTYAGMYPDGVIRLIKKGKARFPAKSVHEQILVDGQVSWLSHDLIHLSNPTLKRYFLGADKYTSLLAEKYKEQKVPKNILFYIWYISMEPIMLFLNLFIRHKGILDGPHGFLFCFFSSLHPSIAFFKYYFGKE